MMSAAEGASRYSVEVLDRDSGQVVARGTAHIFPTLTMAHLEPDRPIEDGVYVVRVIDPDVRRVVEIRASGQPGGRLTLSWWDGRPFLQGDA